MYTSTGPIVVVFFGDSEPLQNRQVDWSTYSAIERQIKRLKITLSKKVYANLLEQINKANKDLREVTHQNRFLEPIRHKRRSKRNAAYFKEIRKNARSLYNVIVKGAAWNCRCKDHHFANLRLEMRHRDLLETKFRVLLTSGMNQPTSSLTSGRNIWTKRELDVEPLIEPDIQSVTDAAGGPPISLSREAEYQKGSLTTRRGVRFAPSLFSAKSSGQEAPILVSHSSATSTYQNSITDLCNAMQCCAPERGIGVIADDSSNKKYHIYVVRQDLLSSCRVSPEPLDRLLMASQNRTLDFYLTRLNRLQIAVTLASSILQLDGTSWLRSRWSSTDILFQHQPPNFDLSQPYLSSRVYADSPGTSAQESSISDINTREHIHGKATNETAYLIHNEILFALGITLIELAFGKPLVDMQRPEDVQSSEILTTIKTTHRLLDQVYNESGGRYGDVVRRCLQCSFDVKDKTFENDEFQEAVFELVVNPLMQDLEAFRA